MTSLPAWRVRDAARGRITEGSFADLAVFDPDTFAVLGTSKLPGKGEGGDQGDSLAWSEDKLMAHLGYRAIRSFRKLVQRAMQAWVAIGRRLFDVDETGHVDGQPQLILQTGYLPTRSQPSVALPVDTDKHVALRQVIAVHLLGGMIASAHLEHDRGETKRFDCAASRRPLGGQLTECGGDEDP